MQEQELAQRVAHSDAAAIRELYGQTVGYMTSVCSRYVVDSDSVADVLQESYMCIFSTIDKFTYRGEGSLMAWIRRIVVNKSVDWVKREISHSEVEMRQDIPDVADDDVSADSVPIDVIHHFISQLPPGYRTIFNMYVLDGISHKEIASRLNIKESTSASQLLRAKALLAKAITEYKRNNE